MNATDQWIVLLEPTPGTLLSYFPMLPFAEAIDPLNPRGMPAQAKAMLGKKLSELKKKGLIDAKERMYFSRNEYCLWQPIVAPVEDETGTVDHVKVIFQEASGEYREKIVMAVLATWDRQPPVPDGNSSWRTKSELKAKGMEGLELMRSEDDERSTSFELRKRKR